MTAPTPDALTAETSGGQPSAITMHNGVHNSPDASARLCGEMNADPAYPYQCTKPRGHDERHGYAGVFWSTLTTEASEGLTKAEVTALLDCWRAAGPGEVAPTDVFAAVERIIAAREAAAANRGRAEGLREAADALFAGEGPDIEAYTDDRYGDWLLARADSPAGGDQ